MSSGLPKPTFHLFYRGVDISGDLDPDTTSVSYTDYLHGKADEMELTVHDKDGLWKGPWRPEHGDVIRLVINDGRGGILPAGSFEMDEPNATGGRDGDFMTIRGLAAPVSNSLRTKITKAYERQTTKDVVNAVAAEIGMAVEGNINELFHARVTQRRERYLEFIKRFAEETGHYFNLRGSTIIFTNFASIDSLPPVSLVHHGDRKLIDYDFKFQSEGTFSSGKASYLDETKGAKVEFEQVDDRVTTGDTLRITGERLESAAHAEARIKSELHYANRQLFSGSTKTSMMPDMNDEVWCALDTKGEAGCLMGVKYNANNTPPYASSDDIGLVWAGGSVHVNKGSGAVTINTSGTVKIVAASIELESGTLTHNGTDISDKHKHSGVDTGPSKTGEPV